MLFRPPRAPAADSEPYYIAFRLPIKPLDRELPDRMEEPSGRPGRGVDPPVHAPHASVRAVQQQGQGGEDLFGLVGQDQVARRQGLGRRIEGYDDDVGACPARAAVLGSRTSASILRKPRVAKAYSVTCCVTAVPRPWPHRRRSPMTME